MKYSGILPASICIFGVISHVFLIVAFIKDPLKCFKNSGTYLVENLAVSDLLTCLISPFSRHPLGTWHSALLFVKHITIGVSILTMAAISIDRFLMTANPVKYRVWVKGKFIIVWLASTWLIFSGISSETFIHYSFQNMAWHIRHTFEMTVIIFSGMMYWLTYYMLRKKQSKNLALENISNRQEHARVVKEKHFLKTISFIACIQIVCIVSSSIFFSYRTFQGSLMPTDSPSAWILNDIFDGLFCLNFAVNPVVYVLRLPNYSKTFYLLYCCKAGKR